MKKYFECQENYGHFCNASAIDALFDIFLPLSINPFWKEIGLETLFRGFDGCPALKIGQTGNRVSETMAFPTRVWERG